MVWNRVVPLRDRRTAAVTMLKDVHNEEFAEVLETMAARSWKGSVSNRISYEARPVRSERIGERVSVLAHIETEQIG